MNRLPAPARELLAKSSSAWNASHPENSSFLPFSSHSCPSYVSFPPYVSYMIIVSMYIEVILREKLRTLTFQIMRRAGNPSQSNQPTCFLGFVVYKVHVKSRWKIPEKQETSFLDAKIKRTTHHRSLTKHMRWVNPKQGSADCGHGYRMPVTWGYPGLEFPCLGLVLIKQPLKHAGWKLWWEIG